MARRTTNGIGSRISCRAEKASRRIAGDFLRHLTAAAPYKIYTVLTDNGAHFTTPAAGGSAVPEIKLAL